MGMCCTGVVVFFFIFEQEFQTMTHRFSVLAIKSQYVIRLLWRVWGLCSLEVPSTPFLQHSDEVLPNIPKPQSKNLLSSSYKKIQKSNETCFCKNQPLVTCKWAVVCIGQLHTVLVVPFDGVVWFWFYLEVHCPKKGTSSLVCGREIPKSIILIRMCLQSHFHPVTVLQQTSMFINLVFS